MAWRFMVVAMISGCTPRQLAIRTPPGAYVFREGQLVGRTPTTVDADRPLQVYLPGFLPYRIEGKRLEVMQIDVALDDAQHAFCVEHGRARDRYIHPIASGDARVSSQAASQPTPGLPTPVNHHTAWILTKAAIDAACAEDCNTVKTIATEVQRADATLHDVVFVHEIAIARCLATP